MASRLLADGVAGAARGGAGGFVLGGGALARLHAVGRLAAGGGARGGRRARAVRAQPRRRHADRRRARACSPRAVRVLDELDARAARARRRAGRRRAGPARRVRDRRGRARPDARWRRCRRSSTVTLREGTTPALTRALRAGTLDLAILAHTPPFRPPDAESPPLELTTLSERELVIGVPAQPPVRDRRARSRSTQLAGQIWVASRSDAGDSLLGVWPGLAERPDVRYVVRDWLAKLQIVAAGLAITTLAPVTLDVAARRRQGRRRARRAAGDCGAWCWPAGPGRWTAAVAAVADALVGAARA